MKAGLIVKVTRQTYGVVGTPVEADAEVAGEAPVDETDPTDPTDPLA